MRNLSSLITSRTSTNARPSADRRREPEKSASEAKPKPKRCLNEAAHKLNR